MKRNFTYIFILLLIIILFVKFKNNDHVDVAKKSSVSNIPPATGLLRQIQKMDLIILKKFDRVCRKHNLKYWLDYGTLIGAVRHNGFIPWDDDVDVCMPIDDYNKFLKLNPKEFGRDFGLVTYECGMCTKMTYNFCYPRNSVEKDYFIHQELNPNIDLFIDIFCYYPTSSDINFVERCRSEFVDYFNKNKVSGVPLSGFNNLQKMAKKVTDKFYDPSGKYYSLGTEWIWSPVQKFMHRKEELFPLKEHIFEGYNFYVPNKWDAVLKRGYGDYMLPPENKKPAHMGQWTKDKEQIKRFKEMVSLFLDD